MKFVVCVMLTALFVAGQAHAGRISCQIDASSQEGGRLVVTTWDYGPDSLKFLRDHPAVRMIPPPAGIAWYPPASGASVAVVFDYDGSDLSQLGAPSEVYAEFMSPDNVKPGQYSASVSNGGAQSWQFDQGYTDFITDQVKIPFQNDGSGGKAVATEMSQNEHIKVDILTGGKAGMSENFNLSVTEGRDQLLAYARHLVETDDPRVCRER
jgi:hypothetical protein